MANKTRSLWSFLKLGRVFRRLGLPPWTFAGIGISAIWFTYLGTLIEKFIDDLITPGKIFNPTNYIPLLIMFLMPFIIIVLIGLWQTTSSQFLRRNPLEYGLNQPEGRKGLILLVSNPNSAMFAISYHYVTKGTLKKVWLLPSESGSSTEFGSSTMPVAEAIKTKCSENQYNIKIEIHPNGVSPADAQDTYDAVRRIFRLSGYEPHEIIADFTGGTKPMSVGMIMACLPVDRELEYVAYDGKHSHGPFITSYQHSAFDLIG
jgi:CRISPR-associated protein (Cas_Cas02710)